MVIDIGGQLRMTFSALARKRRAALVFRRSDSMKSIRVSVLVDGPEQVFPLASHPDVGLVHAPGRRSVAPVPAHPLIKLRRVALDPAA